MTEQHRRYHLNVIGPYYVVDGCCTACGVPESVAPELFGGAHDHCFVKQQPQSTDEVDAMLNVIVAQDLGCIRYAGSDEKVLRRLAESGESAQCDVAPPRDAVRARRDHVVFSARADAGPWTRRRILERLVSSVAAWRSTSIFDDGTVATVSVAWFEDNYYRLEVLASHRPGEWLVRHHGPPGMSDSLQEWLAKDELFHGVRWQTKAQWKADGPSQPKPW